MLFGLPVPITQPVTCYQQFSAGTCVNMTGCVIGTERPNSMIVKRLCTIQSLKCARVVRINYSLLYGHLDVDKLLPKLPEKDLIDEAQLKAAQSYQQRFAKNAVVIAALLKFDRPSHGLLKFCDTLETTPGQEHLGRKLLKGITLLLCDN